FTQFTSTLTPTVASIVSVLIFAVFGLLLFYATRVGDGTAVKRFSVVTLIVLVIPSLYIIVASLASGLPLHSIFVNDDGSTSVIVILASIALGYGVPYTFLSGFEVVDENAVAVQETDDVLEGGIEADILDEEDVEDTEEAVEEATEETEESTEE
ncbi:MAG: hypothetical protein IJ366_07000, partial [Clostridia bacterium]|nr:hypothetical protein [Clostridia bacterium]